jgi:hypothetical protein
MGFMRSKKTNIIMKKILFTILALISSSVFSQTINPGNLDLIKKNILSYRVFYIAKEIGNEYKFSRDCFLPTLDWSLKLEIEIDTIAFPNNKNYKFYRIYNQDYSYFKFDDNENIITKKSNCGFVPFSKRLLVAINNEKILFISGMFFKDPISHFFALDKRNPLTFINYLKVKLFNYSINGIKFKKSTRKKIIFEGFVSNINDTVTIEINTSNFDDIIVYYNNVKEEVSLE